MSATILHEDEWGSVIDRPEAGYIEIRWYDATAEMTGEQFNAWLARFAGHVEQTRRAGALVDAVQFAMPMDRMSVGWRDEHIIPRYEAAGIAKFAFVMPAAMPAIGNAPAPEGPASFPTGYFGKRSDALAWLAS